MGKEMNIFVNCDCHNFELKYPILSVTFEDVLFISVLRTRTARCLFSLFNGHKDIIVLQDNIHKVQTEMHSKSRR